jgi:GT2 family glycosyltransferase
MDATVLYVAFATPTIDMSWIPSGTPVIVVHNDSVLDPSQLTHEPVTHLHPGENLGFGGGVNHALAHVTTERVVLCNPDADLLPEHWHALTGAPHQVVTIPLVDDAGRSTSVISPYWTPISLLITAFRLGSRFAPLGSRRRRALSRLSGSWERKQRDALGSEPGEWPLQDRWVSGAVFSIDTERLRSVNGFDDSYFLYFEDTDLCQRLASRYPDMRAQQRGGSAGRHAVGGSAEGTSGVVERIRRESAGTYAQRQPGWAWKPVQTLLR